MRIVSWNMQGQFVQPADLREALHELDIDAYIAQEPPGTNYDLKVNTSRKRRTTIYSDTAQNANWKWQPIDKGNTNGQDRYFVAWHEDRITKPTITKVKDGSNPEPNHARQYAIISFTKGKETIRVATAHAPFDQGNDEVTESYMSWLLGDAASQADLFMGDTNLASNSGVGNKLYAALLCSPTTNAKNSNPFDRIFGFTKAVMNDKLRCGRIGAPDAKLPALYSKDKRGGCVIDLDAKFKGVWGKSDHLAIYVDTDPSVKSSTNSDSTSEEQGYWEIGTNNKPVFVSTNKKKRKNETNLMQSTNQDGHNKKIKNDGKEEENN